MSNMNKIEKIKYPKKVFVTVPGEIFDRLNQYGMSKIDMLITNLLSDYFTELDNEKK